MRLSTDSGDDLVHVVLDAQWVQGVESAVRGGPIARRASLLEQVFASFSHGIGFLVVGLALSIMT